MLSSEPQGMIRLHRYSQFHGCLRGFRVYIDGLLVGRIRNGETEEYLLPVGDRTLQIKLDFASSPELPVRVRAGEVVSLRCGQNLRRIYRFNLFDDRLLCLEINDGTTPSAITTGTESHLIQLAPPMIFFALSLFVNFDLSLLWKLTIFMLVVSPLITLLQWRSCYIATDDMAPTLQRGDRLLVARSQTPPQRGKIVQFQARIEGRNVKCICRVVGLPGEEIKIEGGTIFIDGEPLQRHYLPATYNISMSPRVIPSSEYFVLADNPDRSVADSRTLGTIRSEKIQGFVRRIFWPLNRMQSM